MNTTSNTQLIDYIKENLTGDTQQNALSFVQHFISLGMTYRGDFNDGRIAYKDVTVWYTYFGNSINTIHGYPEPWNVWPSGDYSEEIESVPFADRMKEIAWANAHNHDVNCPNINTWCRGGKRRIIFGREFDSLCVSVMAFTNPDAETIDCMKKLTEMKKHQIDTTKK